MILDKMFGNTPFNFERRCRIRIRVSAGLILLGFVALAASYLYGDIIPVAFLEPESGADFIREFYTSSGFGLIAAALITMFKNIRYLKNEELRRRRAVEEGDERNKMIGMKCWAYAGYSLFLCLYIGILVSGYISLTVLRVLLVVLGVYGCLLFAFYLLLQKNM